MRYQVMKMNEFYTVFDTVNKITIYASEDIYLATKEAVRLNKEDKDK